MCSFYSIGRNQEDIIYANDSSEKVPRYATYIGALQYVYESSLGGYDTSSYKVGNSRMEPVLITLFFLLTFIMTVHLLNMLIAIMGESFSDNKENKEANQRMSELAFVVENWWIRPIKK